MDRPHRPRRNHSGPHANLIGKGIVYAPEHGVLAYTVLGIADYARRRDEDH